MRFLSDSFIRVHLIPGGSPSDISVRQHPIPFLALCRHEIKEGGIFDRKHLYVSMCVAESSASRSIVSVCSRVNRC